MDHKNYGSDLLNEDVTPVDTQPANDGNQVDNGSQAASSDMYGQYTYTQTDMNQFNYSQPDLNQQNTVEQQANSQPDYSQTAYSQANSYQNSTQGYNQNYNQGYNQNYNQVYNQSYNQDYNNYNSYNQQPRNTSTPGSGSATGCLVCGIFSIITCSWCGIFGIVLSIISLCLFSKSKKLDGGIPSGSARAGQICAIIGLVLSILVLLYFIFVFGVSFIVALTESSDTIYY